ncbi:TRAP transporter permease [Halegenticoccus tardaugens]|uniref:TRAP transporter permease n=1 Tax=Halegenticoccus tardaugens TaxID=2071624 RepID=UPI00100A361A|nr:TRAP transporter fused permease subunit [Halegenticoccus tardaugens]
MSVTTERRFDGDRILRGTASLLAISLTAYTLYYAYDLPFVQLRHSNVFLGAGVALFYLTEALKRRDGAEGTDADDRTDAAMRIDADERSTGVADRPAASSDGPGRSIASIDGIVCLLSAVAAIGVAAYVEVNFQRLQSEAPVIGFSDLDFLVGAVIVVLVADATRRAYGAAITGVVLAAILYAMAGPWLPGFLGHTGMGWTDVARYGAIGLTGTYGFVLGVGTTWVAVFIMFAGLAKSYGALDYVLDAGSEVGTELRSGVVQVAVIASMAMGSITGSAAANTATTGSFTIPMMQRQGVRDDFAAAIESVASSGGQMMPPVMGVAAFLMADMLQVPYVDVIKAGLLPALLFYFSVGLAVQFVVLKFGWTAERTGTFDARVLRRGVHFAVPLAVLVYTLVVVQLTPLSAGLYTMAAMVATMYVRNLYVDGLSIGTLRDTTAQTLDGFREGAVEMAPLVGVLAAMGIIISMLTQTGLAQKISLRMVALTGGVLVAVLVMAMLLSILFGLGMPTPAAYILVVILVAPGLIEVGVADIVAHLFVFYFAMLSAITPPVAVAVAVGSRIADANFMRTGKQAMRIGAPGFLIPFALVANPALVSWSLPATPVAALVVSVGVVALVAAATGYDGRNDLAPSFRVGYLALAAVALFAPVLAVQAGAVAVILAGLGLVHLAGDRRSDVPTRGQ